MQVCLNSRKGNDFSGHYPNHFEIDDDVTRLMVQLDYVPEGVIEKLGVALGAADRRVKGDLERFKQLVEADGYESGAWRGTVERAEEHPTAA